MIENTIIEGVKDKTEETKTNILKDTSDEINIDADELRDIINKSKEEYASINASEQTSKSRLPIIMILAGMLILIILIFKTVSQTKDTVETRGNSTESYKVIVNENGEAIDSYQNIEVE